MMHPPTALPRSLAEDINPPPVDPIARDSPHAGGANKLLPSLLARLFRRKAELLGDSKRVAADRHVCALTDHREVDRSIPLARVVPTPPVKDSTGDSTESPRALRSHV